MNFNLLTKSFLGVTGLGVSLYYYSPESFDGISRPLVFWRGIFPIYLKYRYTQWTQKNPDPQVWEDLHVEYAPKVLEIILKMKGIYIKVGQLLATRPDIAPLTYRETFKVLLDGVTGISGEEAKRMVEVGLGKNIDQVFSAFDDKPMAAASIAQVHRATLLDGTQVVVKVQHPNAYHLFQKDIGTIANFVRLAQPEQAIILNELETQMYQEFDFKREAWSMQLIHDNTVKKFPKVVIPKPIPGLVSHSVLVMEYVSGIKLIDAVMNNSNLLARQLGISFDELYERSKRMDLSFKLRYTFNLYLHTFYRYCAIIYNYSIGMLLPKLKYDPPLLDVPKLYNDLLQVHGRHFLIDGIFNGDPHPGNILLTNDGKLGLIDFGQVKCLSRKDRRDAANLILLLEQGEKKKKETIEYIKSMGFETEKNDEFVLYKSTVIGLDRDDLETTEGMGLQNYLEYLDKRDRTKKLPDQFFLAIRMCIILRGISQILGPGHPPISIAHEWKKLALECISSYPENSLLDNEMPTYDGIV